MPETTTDLLTAYLSDAHSIEEQTLEQFRDARDIAGGDSLKAAFRDVTARAGDQETERLAERILLEERSAQAKLRSLLREAAQLSLAEAGISAQR